MVVVGHGPTTTSFGEYMTYITFQFRVTFLPNCIYYFNLLYFVYITGKV